MSAQLKENKLPNKPGGRVLKGKFNTKPNKLAQKLIKPSSSLS